MYDDFQNVWGKATGLSERGRHQAFKSAVAAALRDLMVEKNSFYDTVCENWRRLYPKSAMRPGRFENGKIYLYVRSAPAMFANRPKLPAVKRELAKLPGAPAKIELGIEIHSERE